MNILVNALPLKGLLTGMPRYVRCLYQDLQNFPGVSVSYFDGCKPLAQMPAQAAADTWSEKTDLLWSLPAPLIFFWNALNWLRLEKRLKKQLNRKDFHVYHETTFFPPNLAGIPVVYTLYDLSLLKYRKEHPRERVWFFDLFFKRGLRHAAHIITISEFMRNEILETLELSPRDVTAITLAPDPGFSPRSSAGISRALEDRGWPNPYILSVGTLEPRKNIDSLIRAMSMTETPIPLILAGWSGWGDKPWRQNIERLGLEERIFFAGYVDEPTLTSLYSGASAFVYPSLYEGFGLPVLEAMACGCPVICSNAASLPEVCADAALLFDPYDPRSIAVAIDQVLAGSRLKESLIERGFKRASQFTWQETAARTLEVFKNSKNSA